MGRILLVVCCNVVFRDPLHLQISVTAVIIIAGAFCILQSHLILSCLVSPVLYVLPMHADTRTMSPFAGWSGSRSGWQSCLVLTCSPMMRHQERTGFGSAVQIGIPIDTISSLLCDCIHDVFDFSSIIIHNICNSAHCLNFLSDLPLTSRHACIIDRLIDHIHDWYLGHTMLHDLGECYHSKHSLYVGGRRSRAVYSTFLPLVSPLRFSLFLYTTEIERYPASSRDPGTSLLQPHMSHWISDRDISF